MCFINLTSTNGKTNGDGGAIYNYYINTKITLINCTFTNNTAENGGAIYNTGGITFFVSDSTFSGNMAGFYVGGDIHNAGGNFYVCNSTFSGNKLAIYGGAIFNSGSMFVARNIMFGNNASVSGPMIYNNGSMGVLNLTYLSNSTVLVNSSSVILYATLTDYMGNTVSGQRIYFYVNGTLVGSVVSDRDGRGNMSFNVHNSMRPSVLPVNGSYEGSTGYDINILNGELILPVNTNLTINNHNGTVGRSTTINGTVTDENGNPLAGVTLNITVNGFLYTVTINGVGFWSLSSVPNVVGSLNVVVSWVGNDTHYEFTNSSILNVISAATNSTINVSNGVVGKNITLSGVAIDENGNPLVGVILNVTVNSVVYTVTTNSVGVWSLSYVPNVSGNIGVLVSCIGNSTHMVFLIVLVLM